MRLFTLGDFHKIFQHLLLGWVRAGILITYLLSTVLPALTARNHSDVFTFDGVTRCAANVDWYVSFGREQTLKGILKSLFASR